MENQELIQDLNLKIIDLIDSFGDKLPVYEIGFALIVNAVGAIFSCAPSELIAIKTINASIESGINQYEENRENQL